jgi:hypothetical protein
VRAAAAEINTLVVWGAQKSEIDTVNSFFGAVTVTNLRLLIACSHSFVVVVDGH